ncbi:MAG: 50S ribosomal protein L6 [Candidatus Cloacimonas sp. SDB]|nr:MAG: 50S ribosomal protein L6 [Candidatus Cloacimonas sp. SDB]
MSRIGRTPIQLPDGIKVDIEERKVTVTGKLGTLDYTVKPGISVTLDDGKILVERSNDSREQKSFHGLARALINNLVKGVTEGYSRSLQVIGTGYSAEMAGPWLKMNLGYSHEILVEVPENLKVETQTIPRREQGALGVQAVIKVSGIHKEDVGKFAAEIRACRKPAPNFKGKGIRWEGEHVRVVSKAGT